jgi:adhesin/invasin
MIRARAVVGWRRSVAVGISILALVGCTLTTDAPRPQILGYISGDLQTTAAGTALANPLTVIVIDQYGNALSNVTVNWVIVSGGGSLSAPATPSDLNGVAQVTYTAGPTAGSATISATVAGLGTLTFTATIT